VIVPTAAAVIAIVWPAHWPRRSRHRASEGVDTMDAEPEEAVEEQS